MPIREAGRVRRDIQSVLQQLKSCKKIMIAVYEKKGPGLKEDAERAGTEAKANLGGRSRITKKRLGHG
jgi:soluble P-type ATPase